MLKLVDLDGTPADYYSEVARHGMIIHQVEFVVNTLTATDTIAPVVALDYTPSGGSRTEWVTITVPDASAVGTTHAPSTQPNPVTLSAGDSWFLQHVTAGTDAGTSAGDGYFIVYYEILPDSEFA